METKFNGAVADADPEVLNEISGDPPEGEALARVEAGSLARAGEVLGEVKASDIVMPYLHLVQSIGDLSRKFKFGQWVIGKETLIADVGEAMSLVVVTIKKYYNERFSKYDANGPRPRVFQTEAEVFAENLRLEWKDDVAPTAEPVADIICLIKFNGKADPVHFPLEVAGDKWAAVCWSCRRTAYTRAAKTVFSARSLELRDCGLLGGVWSLSSREATINGNVVAAPVLNLIGRNDADKIAQIKSACGA